MSHDLSVSAQTAHNQLQTGFLARTYDNWQARKSVRSLLELDDHILRDFGTCRCEVEWAAHLPLSVNAVLALDELSRLNTVDKVPNDIDDGKSRHHATAKYFPFTA